MAARTGISGLVLESSYLSSEPQQADPLSIDEIITMALGRCSSLPPIFTPFKQQISELHSRLAYGRLHLAVVGEFNRGKSTFINSLIGTELLPTSVLPITSVPTHIIYGKEPACAITFLKDKPAITVTTSTDAVRSALLKYVAEENNPNNQFGVRSVEVTVPAELLENGTVLIDTPGFGSTYLHNTQTALGALADCDAVLFLLSVDSPVTQTEVEFLKLVVAHVPRIFFILNKTDLLNGENIEKIERFVGEVIMTTIKPSAKPHIFTISAKTAQHAAKHTLDDIYWKKSGMESVKNDIVSFMAREKYFTLSQALHDKLIDAVDGICAILKKELQTIESPLEGLRAERTDLTREATEIKALLEKELAIIAAEKKAIAKFFDETLAGERLKLLRKIHETTDTLLNNTTCSSESLRSITVAINRVLPDALSAFKTRTIAAVNRPLKRAVLLHGKEYGAATHSLHKSILSDTSQKNSGLTEKLDAIEIDTDDRPDGSVDQKPLKISLLFSDHFFGRAKKIKRLHSRYDHQIDDMIKNDLFAFSKHIKGRIDTVFLSLATLLTSEYQQLIGRLDLVVSHKESAMNTHTTMHAQKAATLNGQLASFSEILRHLHQ